MAATSPKTVLFVDDSELLVDVAKLHLELQGLNVITATNLSAMTEALVSTPPDLIICDVQMPDATRGRLEAVLLEVEVPVWLFSGLEAATLAERAAAVQATGFVTKAEGLEALVERVRASLL
jgi:DNA-binding NtrC family response regulator